MSRYLTITINKDMSIERAVDCILQQIQTLNNEKAVVLDLNMLPDRNVRNISLLIIISYLTYKKTHHFIRIQNISGEVDQYFTEIGFWNLSYISRREHRGDLKEAGSGGGNIILPITWVKDYRQLDDLYARLRQKQSLNKCSSKLQSDILKVINILGENCLDHCGAKEDSFFVFIEEEEEQYVIVVLDMGMGFYKSLVGTYAFIESDKEAIERVLIDNISRRGEEGGLGYREIKDIIKRHTGRIMIRSGAAIVHFKAGQIKETVETAEKIIGSCVMIELEKGLYD